MEYKKRNLSNPEDRLPNEIISNAGGVMVGRRRVGEDKGAAGITERAWAGGAARRAGPLQRRQRSGVEGHWGQGMPGLSSSIRPIAREVGCVP